MSKKTMKAVVYKHTGTVALEERPLPGLMDSRDAVIKVTLTTICSSDIHIKHGAVPRAIPGTILGHEFVGIVDQVGNDVKWFKPGDRVAVNVETFCGECFFCKRGYVNNCTDEHGGWALGCRIDGGQAEYVRVPFADNGLTHIPDDVTDEDALFTGDILSTGYWGASLAEIKPADTVAVIGAGPTGLCTLMCAGLYGPARVIAIDVSDERLELAKKQGLADLILNPLKQERTRSWRQQEARTPSRLPGRLQGPMQWSAWWPCMRRPRSSLFLICMGKTLFLRPVEWTPPAAGKSWN